MQLKNGLLCTITDVFKNNMTTALQKVVYRNWQSQSKVKPVIPTAKPALYEGLTSPPLRF